MFRREGGPAYTVTPPLARGQENTKSVSNIPSVSLLNGGQLWVSTESQALHGLNPLVLEPLVNMVLQLKEVHPE